MTACPTPIKLWQLLRDELSPAEDDEMSRHVEQCRACQEELNRLSERVIADDRTPEFAGYHLGVEVGRGMTGIVYLTESSSDGQSVALKILHDHFSNNLEARRRFEREVAILHQLEHPGIVRIFASGEFAGRAYYTMEFVTGTTLAAQTRGRPQPYRNCAQIVVMLAEAIHTAHSQKIIHRDLKPENILLSPSNATSAVAIGEGSTVRFNPKIVDFGIAKLPNDSKVQTHTGELLGTLEYMAPEQLRGDATITPAADLYALGAILYKLLTGAAPHRASTFPEMLHNIQFEEPASVRILVPGIPPSLELICSKCLQKRPLDRYSTAQDLADDLNRVLAGQRPLARKVPIWRRAIRWGSRHPTTVAITAAAALLLTSLIVGLLAFAQQERRNSLAIAEERDEVQRNLKRSLEAYSMLITDIQQLVEGWGLEPEQHFDQIHRVVAFLEPLLASEPENSDYRNMLANAWHLHGRIPHDNDGMGAKSPATDEIVKSYLRAIEHCTALLADPTNEPKVGPLKANLLNNLGNIYRGRKAWSRAIEFYDHSIQDWERLVKTYPENLNFQIFHANVIGNRAGMVAERWKTEWKDEQPSQQERTQILASTIARLRAAMNDYQFVLATDPSLRLGQGLSFQSKDFNHLVELEVLSGDVVAARATIDDWLTNCFDLKDAHVAALQQQARLFASTSDHSDLDLLLRRIDDGKKQKVFLVLDDLKIFDDIEFDSVRDSPQFQDKLRSLGAALPIVPSIDKSPQ